MPIEADLKELFLHSITIEPFAGTDEWGNKSWGAGVSYPARVRNTRKKVLNPTGGDIVSETIVYVDTVAEIGMYDRLTLPAGFEPNQPEIIKVIRLVDEHGLYCTVIHC